jgi:hypothetical protein
MIVDDDDIEILSLPLESAERIANDIGLIARRNERGHIAKIVVIRTKSSVETLARAPRLPWSEQKATPQEETESGQ